MDDRVYDVKEERLGDMCPREFSIGYISAATEDSDSVANETVDAGVAFGRIVVDKSD